MSSYEKGLSSELSTDSAALEGQVLSEEAQLAKLGYKQEFTRDFSWISTFSFAFSISGLLATVRCSFLSVVLRNRLCRHGDFRWRQVVLLLRCGVGISPIESWVDGRFIGGASCMCIAISVAEIVSAYPTSGGMYFTVKVIALFDGC